MLSVTNKPLMLSVIVLNAVMLSVKPFHPSLLFVAPESISGSSITRKRYAIVERLSREKHTSLLCKSITYVRKFFITLAPVV